MIFNQYMGLIKNVKKKTTTKFLINPNSLSKKDPPLISIVLLIVLHLYILKSP